MNFQQSIKLSDKEFLTLVSGTGDNGIKFFAYILTDLYTYKKMQADYSAGKENINFRKYGKLVKYGLGHEPSKELRAEMEKEFKFKH